MRPELPTASAGSSQAPTAAVDNSAPVQPARSLFISWGKTVQTSGATSKSCSNKMLKIISKIAISALVANAANAGILGGPEQKAAAGFVSIKSFQSVIEKQFNIDDAAKCSAVVIKLAASQIKGAIPDNTNINLPWAIIHESANYSVNWHIGNGTPRGVYEKLLNSYNLQLLHSNSFDQKYIDDCKAKYAVLESALVKISDASKPAAQAPAAAKQSGSVAAPAADRALAGIDGRWYSDEWKYGYTLRGGVGTATISNSPSFKPGDRIIFLKSAGETRFVGEQIYKDGKFYTVSVSLMADGRLAFQGDRNVKWIMRRDD